MKKIHLLFVVLLSSQLAIAGDECSTFFGGAQVKNDMIAKALSTRQRIFDSVASVESKNYRYETIENNNSCEFSFRFYIEVAFEFKDLPDCVSHFRVTEDVTYYGAVDGVTRKSRVDNYEVDHTFDDLICH